MGYYVTMEGVSFKSLLSPDEMKEAVKQAGVACLGYGEDSDADFSVRDAWTPPDKLQTYVIVPLNEDYYFKYDQEKIDSMVDFLKTVVAPGTYTYLMFHGEDTDMWGYLVRPGKVNYITYKLVVKTDTGEEVDMEEFVGEAT